MPAVELTPDDLTPFASIPIDKAAAMIDDALARAAEIAPCITTDGFTKAAAAKAILRGAVLRWHEAGTGALQSQTASIYGMTLDTRQQRRSMFWPSEIEELQKLCRDSTESGAFSIDTLPSTVIAHADICSLNFGATYCSCGAILTGSYPLYEV